MLYKTRCDDLLILIFVQYTKHRMQITQELREYDLTTNKLREVNATNVQQTTPVHLPNKFSES